MAAFFFVGATAAGGARPASLVPHYRTSTTSFMPILHLRHPIGGAANKKVNVADLRRRRRIVACSHIAASSSSSSSTGGSASEAAVGEVKKGGGRGLTRPRPISPELQQLVGVPEIPRTQALKLIWAYIKEHNLQDPENKKIIVCDEMLKKIFDGKERVGFLEVSRLINPHFLK